MVRRAETDYIKYYYGSFQKAKKQGVLTEYLFWLQLKRANSHGRIMNREKLIHVSKLTDYSNASISNLIKRTIAVGFIQVLSDDSGVYAYQLSSYKFVMTRLKIRNIWADYKFIRISQHVTDHKKFKCLIQSLEIHNDFKLQDFREKERLQKRLNYYKGSKSKKRDKKIAEITNKLYEAGNDLQLHRASLKLSCKSIASKLGYKTASFGNKLQSRIQLFDFGEVINNGASFIKEMKLSEFRFDPIKTKSFWVFGKVFTYNCNNIHFMLSHYIQKQRHDHGQGVLTCL